MSDSKFGPMIDPLNAVFGPDVFQHWHTGGGCTAIQGFLDHDLSVLITDDPDTQLGEEAFITDMLTREQSGGDGRYGYTVGVYGDEGCELLAMESCYTADELPALVVSLLLQAATHRWRFTPSRHADFTKGVNR